MADAVTTLVGRDRHQRELATLVSAIASGQGYALLLSGDAGAGKTALAEEAARLAEAASTRVGWVTCWRSAAEPLSVWRDLVESTATPPSAVPVGDSSDLDPEGARTELVRALARHLLDELSDQPTLLVVDDLQWADPLSVHALDVLIGRIRSTRVGVLCTVRHGESTGSARVDEITARSRHLLVPPLNPEQLAELAVAVTGASMAAGAAARLHDRTAGNVLFARELLERQGEGWELATDRRRRSSETVAIFTERVAALSPPCQHTLEAASVIGRRFRLDILIEALGRETDDVLDLIGEAESEGLVRNGGLTDFEFSHPLMAEACYGAGGLPRRVRLHRDVGEAMERLRERGVGVPAVEIAHHFASAAAAGVAHKAAHYAAIAGREDMDRLAYEDAVRDFGLALQARELCETDDHVLAELLLGLADAHAATGDRPAARAAYERAAGVARRHGWADELARAALGVGSGPGGFEIPPFDDHQIALLEEAAAVATGALRSLVLARLSVAMALDASASDQRSALSSEAIALARSADDPSALGYALASWCDVIPGPESAADRLGAADEILRCASRARDVRLQLLGRRLRVVALLETGRIDDFDAEVGAFAASADRLDQPGYSWYVHLWRAMRASMEGRLEDAERSRDAAAAIGEAASSENALMLVASQRAMLECELRQPGGAVDFFTKMLDDHPSYVAMVRPALAYAQAATGDPGRARDLVAALDPSICTVDVLGSEFLTTAVMVAHASWLVGVHDHAEALYHALLPHRARFAVDGIAGYLVGSVERTLGILAVQRGDPDLARAHFTFALEAHRRVAAPVLAAGTLRDARACLDGEDLAAATDPERALLGPDRSSSVGSPAQGSDATTAAAVFHRDGEGWEVAWNGQTAHLRHTKGMADLARLIAHPHEELHVLDLVDSGPTVNEGAADTSIDETARRQYRARLTELDADLAEADAHGDIARSERLHLEREALLAELSAAYGLGGRARRTASSSERARSAVTQRIRDAMTRVERVQPELGKHLRRAVHTGTFCGYRPDEAVTWRL